MSDVLNTRFRLTDSEISDVLPWLAEEDFDGIAWIGDPHFTNKAPSRRMDDFLETICGKMAQVANVCEKRNLYPVILGDLVDKEKEFTPKLMSGIIKSLNRFRHIPVTIIGNHDTKTTDFFEDVVLGDSLADTNKENDAILVEETYSVIDVLEETQLVHVIKKPSILGRIKVKGKTVVIGGIPYGWLWEEDVIVNYLHTVFPDKDWNSFDYDLKTLLQADYIFMIAHDNLPFMGANIPTMVEIKKLDGVDMVVNGHIHSPLKPLFKDGMPIHNPGNIIRMALGAGYGAGKLYDPSFSIWNGTEDFASLEMHPIEHKRPEEVFDISGRHAGTQKLRALNDTMRDKFAKALHEAIDTDSDRMDYIPDLAKMVKSIGESLPSDARTEMSALFVEVVDPNKVLGSVTEVFDYYINKDAIISESDGFLDEGTIEAHLDNLAETQEDL